MTETKKVCEKVPLRCSPFFLHHFKYEIPINMIPFDFVLKIRFDRDFILKAMQKKSEHLRGSSLMLCIKEVSIADICSGMVVWDFGFIGGLLRHNHLISVDPIHIQPFGSWVSGCVWVCMDVWNLFVNLQNQAELRDYWRRHFVCACVCVF